METTNPFGIALRDLLVETDYTSASGRPKWAAFAAELEGVHYETLLRAIRGQRAPSVQLMEECARVLRIRPTYFVEYRVYLAQRDFDPREVGFEQAVRNLRAWAQAREQAAGSPLP
jgi:hypothetical protein